MAANRAEVPALLLGLLFAGVLLYVLIRPPDMMSRRGTQFGPGWDCVELSYDSVCMKKLPRDAAVPATPPR